MDENLNTLLNWNNLITYHKVENSLNAPLLEKMNDKKTNNRIKKGKNRHSLPLKNRRKLNNSNKEKKAYKTLVKRQF